MGLRAGMPDASGGRSPRKREASGTRREGRSMCEALN